MNGSSGVANTSPNNSQSSSQPQWIGLALSGGGFRATLFHLGLVRALRDCGLLERVKVICSVSGGSILAAHMALNWDKYTAECTEEGDKKFDEAAREIIKFTRRDLRYRVMRRWFLTLIFPLPFFLNFSFLERFKITRLLQYCYNRLLRKPSLEDLKDSKKADKIRNLSFPKWFKTRLLQYRYKKATFKDLQHLKKRPEIHILATSLTTGAPCAFTNFRFEMINANGPRDEVGIDKVNVSLAVAASSAYPVLFPGIRIDHDVLGANRNQFAKTHYVTDGGVFDNLGIEELIQATAGRNADGGLLIVSDASFNFDDTAKRYKSVMSIPRSIRANDIIMHHLDELRISSYRRKNLCCIGMGELEPNDVNAAPSLNAQRAVQNIETDFKPASKAEVDALLRHGQSKTRDVLRRLGACPDALSLWRPMGDQSKEFDSDHFDKLLKRRKTGRSCWFAFTDWATWAIVLWLGVLVWLPYHFFAAMSRAEPTQDYTILVLDEHDHPIRNAKVKVQFDDVPPSTYERDTDDQGYMRFKWKATAGKLYVHVTVKADGFDPVFNKSYLTPGEKLEIRLLDNGQQ